MTSLRIRNVSFILTCNSCLFFLFLGGWHFARVIYAFGHSSGMSYFAGAFWNKNTRWSAAFTIVNSFQQQWWKMLLTQELSLSQAKFRSHLQGDRHLALVIKRPATQHGRRRSEESGKSKIFPSPKIDYLGFIPSKEAWITRDLSGAAR